MYWHDYYRKNLEAMTLQYRYELNALKLTVHERDLALLAYRKNIASLEATVTFQRQIIEYLSQQATPSEIPKDDRYYDAVEHQTPSTQ